MFTFDPVTQKHNSGSILCGVITLCADNDCFVTLLQMYRYVFDTTLTDKRQRVVADFIVHCGLANASLRDEIYIQLCNLSFPRSSSPTAGDSSITQRTWQLMAHCLSCFKPSNALYSYLLKSVGIGSYFYLKQKPSPAEKPRDVLRYLHMLLCIKRQKLSICHFTKQKHTLSTNTSY